MRQGLARQSRRGLVRLDRTRRGTAWLGMVGQTWRGKGGEVWRGTVRQCKRHDPQWVGHYSLLQRSDSRVGERQWRRRSRRKRSAPLS
jgi:hypothetical protein